MPIGSVPDEGRDLDPVARCAPQRRRRLEQQAALLAAASGLLAPGDRIVSVDGVPLEGRQLQAS